MKNSINTKQQIKDKAKNICLNLIDNFYINKHYYYQQIISNIYGHNDIIQKDTTKSNEYKQGHYDAIINIAHYIHGLSDALEFSKRCDQIEVKHL